MVGGPGWQGGRTGKAEAMSSEPGLRMSPSVFCGLCHTEHLRLEVFTAPFRAQVMFPFLVKQSLSSRGGRTEKLNNKARSMM